MAAVAVGGWRGRAPPGRVGGRLLVRLRSQLASATSGRERYGIDVSNHQGEIDWQAVADDGIEFAYIRTSEGGDFADRRFEANWNGAGDAGIDRISQPTVRAWIESGVLSPVPGSKPVRVDLLALADVKRALDLIRDHVEDRQLLIHVMRVLRDRAALAVDDVVRASTTSQQAAWFP